MKKRIVWMAAACFTVLALLMASCGPTKPATQEKSTPPATEKKETTPTTPKEEKPSATTPAGAEMVKIKATRTDGTVIEKTVEKPRRGGVVTWAEISDPVTFDQSFGHASYAWAMHFTSDGLVYGDWTKGQAGTGEALWAYASYLPPQRLSVGALAEKWEFRDPTTLVYRIRQGIRWQNKPPVNGREFTADDVVFTLKYLWADPRSLFYRGYEYESVTATDKWTVEIKVRPDRMFLVWRATTYLNMHPREVIEKYGNMNDWKTNVGTGPFMVQDYVKGSSLNFTKNPNYWMKDPLIPENQLPYLDGVKLVIVPDYSTRIAALRTGKVDLLTTSAPVTWEDAANLQKTRPELKYLRYLVSAAPAVFMRTDLPPFNDKRVRHALAMGIDRKAIASNYYGGNAEILAWPWAPIPEHKDRYIPLEQFPESTRELFEYKPDKAKQLLAEAGYPNGFKADILCTTTQVDLVSIVKDNWAKIGVDLNVDVREIAVYSTLVNTQPRRFNQFAFISLTFITGSPYSYLQPGNMTNYSEVNDPYLNERMIVIDTAFPDERKQDQLFKEWTPYVVAQQFHIQLPAYYQYNFWWPWVKSYNGEYEVGYGDTFRDFSRYIWLDQDMKERMTGRR